MHAKYRSRSLDDLKRMTYTAHRNKSAVFKRLEFSDLLNKVRLLIVELLIL
jgi:hypothetical protein